MKSFNLNVPDNTAQEFAKEMMALMQKHGVTVENKAELDALVPITERIKTFEDACYWCKENGLSHLVHTHDAFWQEVHASVGGEYLKDVDAYMSLRIICAALNEGWEPQFTEDEVRYYPWFDLYTQEEIDNMDEDERSRVLGRSNSNANANAGVAISHSYGASSHSDASSGGRLCFKERELAKYAGEKFLELWAEFMMFPKEDEE